MSQRSGKRSQKQASVVETQIEPTSLSVVPQAMATAPPQPSPSEMLLPLQPLVTTVEFWQGTFGDEYNLRQQVNWRERVDFWRHIVDLTNATSFLEVGVNAGHNLEALRFLNPNAMMSGVDVNDAALAKAQLAGFDVIKATGDRVVDEFGLGACELALTAGCLIHVAPQDLLPTMAAIRDVSSQYVLAIEYEAPAEEEIEYRGHSGKLWRRPYGEIYQSLGLALVETGVAEGFDRCTYWLLEK